MKIFNTILLAFLIAGYVGISVGIGMENYAFDMTFLGIIAVIINLAYDNKEK